MNIVVIICFLCFFFLEVSKCFTYYYLFFFLKKEEEIINQENTQTKKDINLRINYRTSCPKSSLYKTNEKLYTKSKMGQEVRQLIRTLLNMETKKMNDYKRFEKVDVEVGKS